MPNSEKTPGVIIRLMVNTDAVSIHAIHTACLRNTLTSHYSSEQLEAWLEGRTPEGYLRGAENGEIYLVAERGQAVVGYANCQDQELLSLFVLPEFQNQGVGALLLKACDANADIRWVKATLGAVGFYSRFGFQLVRRGEMEKRGVQIPHILMARENMLNGG